LNIPGQRGVPCVARARHRKNWGAPCVAVPSSMQAKPAIFAHRQCTHKQHTHAITRTQACEHVHTYTCTHFYTLARTRVHAQACKLVCTHTHARAHTHACVHTYVSNTFHWFKHIQHNTHAWPFLWKGLNAIRLFGLSTLRSVLGLK